MPVISKKSMRIDRNDVLIQQGYFLVFSLRDSDSILMQPTTIERTHTLSVDPSQNNGLSPLKGLFATEEWWGNIDTGIIESHFVSGVIVDFNKEDRVLDKNTVVLIKRDGDHRDDGVEICFTNKKIRKQYNYLYQLGNHIFISYIVQETNDKDNWDGVVRRNGVTCILNRIYIKPLQKN